MEIIIAEKITKPGWWGGAYCHCFVYTKKGRNILFKGYAGDIDIELKKLIKKGEKFFYNQVFYGGGTSRSYWSFSMENAVIMEPYRPRRGGKRNSYVVSSHDGNYNNRIEMTFKRMPKRWIPEFDKL